MRIALSILSVIFLSGAAAAQTVDDPARAQTVVWSAEPQAAAAPNGKLALTLRGTVLNGWHVYSLKQAAEGPTPLLVTLDANTVASADGAVTETKPVKFRDPAFGLDTQFYEHAFTLTVPVHLKAGAAAGQQTIPLSVRFQTCNGRICQPPKTVHLRAPVNLEGKG